MKQFTSGVLLCSSAGVKLCVPEPPQEGGDGWVPLTHAQDSEELWCVPSSPVHFLHRFNQTIQLLFFLHVLLNVESAYFHS